MSNVFGAVSSGESVGGSVSKTSNPAPARCPDAQGLGDRRFVDDPAARHVEHDGPGLHPRDLPPADQPARRPREWDVHRHDVRAREQRRHVHEIDPVVRGLLGRQVRVGADDRHVHGPGPDRDGLADLAQTDDAQRPAAQLETGECRTLPLAPAHARVGCRGAAGDAVEQRQRVLRSRDRVACRGVDDRDAGAGRRLEVDVVDTDPGAADDHEPLAGGDQVGVDLDLAPDDERVVIGQDRCQLLAAAADAFVDLVSRRQEVDAFAGDLLCDEDPHAVVPATAMAAIP